MAGSDHRRSDDVRPHRAIIGGPTMFARIGIMRGENDPEGVAFQYEVME
jgi:hypothetical protein